MDGAAAATVFHRWAWRTAVETAYAHTPYYLIVTSASTGCVSGVLPLFLMRSRFFGRILASSPFASYGAICADEPSAAQMLLSAAVQLARELKVEYLELKSRQKTEAKELQTQTGYANYELALEDLNGIWRSGFEKATRAAIRQAERFGLAVEHGHQHASEFYRIVAINMRSLGTPVHSRVFYETLLASYENDAGLYAVRKQQDFIASQLVLRFRGRSYALCSASDPRFLKYRPNNFMYWEILKHEYARGARRFDFGRSLAGGGTAHFKRSMGASGEPLFYEYFLNRAEHIPRIHQGNRALAIATKLWSRLPLRITTGLGPYFIKHVP
ncbi:MAG: FemAB family PEP-CTERM system-associated protein [Acidobacteriales bacterium]|nr:FemAB family PEP-CTERM system-associated protein [Terriglobales bacterium]